MDETTAHAVVKAFWEQREAMARQNPWWGAVTRQMIATLAAPLHPGALRYYRESGVNVPEALR